MITELIVALGCLVVFVGMAVGPLDSGPLSVRLDPWQVEWDDEEQSWHVISPSHVVAATFSRKAEADAWLNRVTQDSFES